MSDSFLGWNTTGQLNVYIKTLHPSVQMEVEATSPLVILNFLFLDRFMCVVYLITYSLVTINPFEHDQLVFVSWVSRLWIIRMFFIHR